LPGYFVGEKKAASKAERESDNAEKNIFGHGELKILR
jgi:hypothetical protein